MSFVPENVTISGTVGKGGAVLTSYIEPDGLGYPLELATLESLAQYVGEPVDISYDGRIYNVKLINVSVKNGRQEA